jgi:hypothetical protein
VFPHDVPIIVLSASLLPTLPPVLPPLPPPDPSPPEPSAPKNGFAVPGVIVMDGTPGSVTYGTTCTGGPPSSVAGTWSKVAVAIRSDSAAAPTAKAMQVDVGDFACCGSDFSADR